MNILVCITCVPDTTTKIEFTENNTKLDSGNVQFIIGPYDEYALSRAVELRDEAGEGKVTVVNVGLSDTEPVIRKALAIGADEAIRVNAFPTDAFFVARQLAKVAGEGEYDMILTGRESIDFNGGQVHGMLGEMLDMPSISPVMRLNMEGGKAVMDREIEGGHEVLEAEMPFVAGCQEPIADWKIPNMRGIMAAKSKPLNVIDPVDEKPHAEVINYELPPEKGACRMIDPEKPEELFDLLKNEAKVL